MHSSAARSFEQPAGVKAAEERATPRDTIAAISTPAGEGAIALIRVSGEDAIGVAVGETTDGVAEGTAAVIISAQSPIGNDEIKQLVKRKK